MFKEINQMQSSHMRELMTKLPDMVSKYQHHHLIIVQIIFYSQKTSGWPQDGFQLLSLSTFIGKLDSLAFVNSTFGSSKKFSFGHGMFKECFLKKTFFII